MKQRFYLEYDTPTAFVRTRFYDSKEEAENNKEFLEQYFGIRVCLKIDEQYVFGSHLD